MTPETHLRKFAFERDQEAFAAVVNHYTGLVYGLALRRSGRAEIALEIAQDVFLTCARKASALVQAATPLGPWLHRATLFETMNHMRKEATHHRHVKAAMASSETVVNPPVEAPDWLEAAPHLDQALNDLAETDRTAIMLRYYSGRSFPEIGNQMGRTEEAARKLCTRALEKLSVLLRRRGVSVSAVTLASALGAHWSVSQAALPAGLAASLSNHVAAQTSAASGFLATLTAMKSNATALTAVTLLLVSMPLAWQWQSLRAARAQAASKAETFEPSSNSPLLLAGSSRSQNSRPTGGAGQAAIRATVERLLALTQGNRDGDFDLAMVMEIDQIQGQIKKWPAGDIRTALDIILASPTGGQARLNLAANILGHDYAEKAPKEAAELGLAWVDKDPQFRQPTLWSAGQWFRQDPAAAAAWAAGLEKAGALESTSIVDGKRSLLEQSRILGRVLADGQGSRDFISTSNPQAAQTALNALVGKMTPEQDGDFVKLAAAIADPKRAGNVIGNWAKGRLSVTGGFEDMGRQIQAKIPANLPPEIRRAALVEGCQVSDLPGALTALSVMAEPAERQATFAELISQFSVGGSGQPEPGWLEKKEFSAYRDDLAAAAALALGSTAFAAKNQDPAVAAQWAARIHDPSLRANVTAQLGQLKH